jgi:pseudaminic acid biosynthesis-associated methylase
MRYKTEQEKFLAGEFGNEYLVRNSGSKIISSNISLFTSVLKSAPQIESIGELGCNIGLNLMALASINPEFILYGWEINSKAAQEARNLKVATITEGTIVNPLPEDLKVDLTFTKGVLIHINPDLLEKVYENLYKLSNRYILIAEYYNPTPVAIDYRGNKNRLFKRDYAGEMIKRFDLKLLDYGFVYHLDNYFPQDDVNWFLLEKK